MTDQYIPLSAREPLSHTVESPKGVDHPITFRLKRPSPMEKQRLNARLFEAGLRNPSDKLVRKAQTTALIRLYPGATGEEMADQVADYYRFTDEFLTQLMDWAAKERERRKDEENGAEPIEPHAKPIFPMSQRDMDVCELYIEEASAHPIASALLGQRARFEADMRFWLARNHVVEGEIDGLPQSVVLTWKDGELDERSLDDLIDLLGDEQFKGLTDAINGQYRITEETAKNSASPLETSPPSGALSETESTKSGEPTGTSTELSTAAIPSSESSPSTPPSSSTSSEPMQKEKPSPTEGQG